MGFIDTYVKKHRLGDISKRAKKHLSKIEKTLDNITEKAKKGLSFLDSIKEHGDQIGDLIERVKQGISSDEGLFSRFRFISSIAIEVYQLVDLMHDEVVPDGLTGEKAWQAKRTFGVQLIYFIWEAVGPLDKIYTWIPFKKTIERKLVRWLAGMGMDAARSLFNVNKEVASFSVNNSMPFIKAI